MELTERQHRMIGAYLRKLDSADAAVAPHDRAQRLANAEVELWKELQRLEKDAPSDEDLAAAMRRFRLSTKELESDPNLTEKARANSATQSGEPRTDLAAPPQATAPPPDQSELASEKRVWLGVCTALASQWGWDVFWLRLVFVVLGAVTGPLALIAYLGVYSELYLRERNLGAPPIDREHLVRAIFYALVAALALYGGTRGVVYVGAALFTRLTSKVLLLGSWGWLGAYHNALLLGVLFVGVPIAVLGALPVPNRWDQTAKRVVQAVFAVYAVVLSLGIASAAVGILLEVIEEIAG